MRNKKISGHTALIQGLSNDRYDQFFMVLQQEMPIQKYQA